MLIDQQDLGNKDLNKLPVRAGCGAWGGCACTGQCHEIIGTIDRYIYENFMENYKTIEDFIKENMSILETEELDEKKMNEYFLKVFHTNTIPDKIYFKPLSISNRYTLLNYLSNNFNISVINGRKYLENDILIIKDNLAECLTREKLKEMITVLTKSGIKLL